MSEPVTIRPIITEVRIRTGSPPSIATYPRDRLKIIQASSPAPGSAGGALVYEFEQVSPSDEWIVNHNFGRYPAAVSVLSIGLQEVNAEVQHVTLNQTRIRFVTPQAGFARLM